VISRQSDRDDASGTSEDDNRVQDAALARALSEVDPVSQGHVVDIGDKARLKAMAIAEPPAQPAAAESNMAACC
jgi:hypothetical protein